MNGSTPSTYLLSMLRQKPQAYARIRGSDAYPGIAGTVFFYQTVRGAVVAAEVSGLPQPPGPLRQRYLRVPHPRGSCVQRDSGGAFCRRLVPL